MGKEKRGFASQTPERKAELARMGAQASLKSKGRHRFTSAQARKAAVKGLEARRKNMVKRAMGDYDRWQTVTVRGREHWTYQMSASFILNGTTYPPGSWLIREKADPLPPGYATALTDAAYLKWLGL